MRSHRGWKEAGEALRGLKKWVPEGNFRAPGTLECGEGTLHTAWGSLPCRRSQVGLDAGKGRVWVGPESEPKMEIPAFIYKYENTNTW